MCVSLARISRRRTKNNATRRKKRGKTRIDRTLTRRARPEAFPRDGNRLWAPELAAPLGRRTHAAVRMRRPAPTTGPTASGGGGGGREATLLPGPARFHAASRVRSPSPSPADFPAQVAAPDTRIRPVFLSRSGVRRDFFSFVFFSFLFFYFIF